MADIDISLNFVMEHRQMSNWCWAAMGKSISVFYDPGSERTQWSIAKDLCGKTTCCSDPSGCDVPKKLSDTLKATGNYVDHINDVIEWEKIKSEIEARRIVGVRTQWAGGGGHFVAIFGVAIVEGTEWVHVDDPLLGPGFMPYEEFRHNYHSSGKWTHTYFTNLNNRPI